MSLQTMSLVTYFQGIWEELSEINIWLLISAVALPTIIVIALMIINKKTGGLKWDTRKLTYGAICIALSFVLSFIKLWQMPNGGSVTAASMLPMLAYGYMAGPLWGSIAGLVYSILQFIQEPYFLSPMQFLFDYTLPFMALSALSGVFRTKNKNINLYSGFALAVVTRFICHFIAGVVFWANYESPLGPTVYSLAYNSFVFVDAIPCFVLISIPAVQKLFKRLPKKQKIE